MNPKLIQDLKQFFLAVAKYAEITSYNIAGVFGAAENPHEIVVETRIKILTSQPQVPITHLRSYVKY